jgi:hypothetical protein
MGPVFTYRTRYEFKADGTYELLMTSRGRGSMSQTPVGRETGVFRVEGDRLTIVPAAGPPRPRRWLIEKDTVTGVLQLVLVLADGKRDVYYAE